MDKTILAYFAGLLDGEGSISIEEDIKNREFFRWGMGKLNHRGK